VPIDVQVTVDDKHAQSLLTAIELTLMGHNLFLYLRDYMQPYMRTRAAARFRGEGDDASGPWAALTAATEEIRTHGGFPPAHPINKRTGELEAFMLRGVIDHSWSVDSATMQYPGRPPTSSLREKLKTAQEGRVKPRTVPRPVARMNMTDMAYFTHNFVFWFGRESQRNFR